MNIQSKKYLSFYLSFRLRATFFVFLFLHIFLGMNGQSSVYKIVEEEGVEVYITGGSTLHDWTVTTSDVSGYPQTLTLSDDQTKEISDFEFAVMVASMKGGRGPTMDKKIKDALKSSDHPAISFRQTRPVSFEAGPEAGSFTLVSEGDLEIAGVVKKVAVDVNGSLEEGLLTFEGQKGLLLSDFGIEPPSAMFGQIKTKNDITVHYRFTYAQQNQ